MSESQISPDAINAIITAYIVENYNMQDSNNAINDIALLRKFCQENPIITYYPSPSKYWKQDPDETIEISFTELTSLDIYDYFHHSPGFKNYSPPENKFDKVLTEYIVELFEKYCITNAISTLEKHTQMLETDPIIYMYLKSGSVLWSFTQLFPDCQIENLQESSKCKFSELSSIQMYYVLKEKESKKVKYQPSLQVWA